MPSKLKLFLMDAPMRSNYVFWAITKMPPDMRVKTVLGMPAEEFRKATPEEQEGAFQIVRNLLPASPTARRD